MEKNLTEPRFGLSQKVVDTTTGVVGYAAMPIVLITTSHFAFENWKSRTAFDALLGLAVFGCCLWLSVKSMVPSATLVYRLLTKVKPQ